MTRKYSPRELADLVTMDVVDLGSSGEVSLIKATAREILADADLYSLTSAQRMVLATKDPDEQIEIFLQIASGAQGDVEGMHWIEEAITHNGRVRNEAWPRVTKYKLPLAEWRKQYRYYRPIPPEGFDFDSYSLFIARPVFQFMEWLNETYTFDIRALIWPGMSEGQLMIGNPLAWPAMRVWKELQSLGRWIETFTTWDTVSLLTWGFDELYRAGFGLWMTMTYPVETAEAIWSACTDIRERGRRWLTNAECWREKANA